MAERRMFCKSIIESDQFMDMPAEAQMLYVRLNMAADDDGFCDNPRAIMRGCGASNDTMKILIAKKFVLTFDRNDGFIVVIKHWRMNNYIRKDNYRETKYKELMRELYYDENKSYSMNPGDGHKPCIPQTVPEQLPDRTQPVDEPYTNRIQTVDEPSTQDRLGKDSIGKSSLEEESIGQVKDNTLNTSIIQVGEIGDCKGEEQSLPADRPDPEDRRAYYLKHIKWYEDHMIDPHYLREQAAEEGIQL